MTQLRHLLNTPVPAQQGSCVMCLYKGCNTRMGRETPGQSSDTLAKGENANGTDGDQQIYGKAFPSIIMSGHYESCVSKSGLFPRRQVTRQ